MKIEIFKNNKKFSPLKRILIFSNLFALISTPFFSTHQNLQAKNRKNTVGDLLNRVDQKTQQKIQLKRKPRFVSRKEIKKIKPPKKLKIHFKKGYEAQLETLINQSIHQLYKLSVKLKKSKARGEIWLRLAQAYTEKAKIVELRLHEQFEKKTAKYLNKKIFKKPKLNLSEARRYNKKSIELYLWYLRDFPKSKKRNQAFFYLGYNYLQMDQKKSSEKYFLKLVKKFPKNPLTYEAYLILAENYFESSMWKSAAVMYRKTMQKKNRPSYFLSIYKLAWCHYKLGNYKVAFNYLYKIILYNKKTVNPSLRRYLKELAKEAMRNSIVFYAEASDYKKARSFFKTFLKPADLEAQLEKLAYFYKDSNYTLAALYTFSDLIKKNPLSTKAFDYQLQSVHLQLAKGQPELSSQQFLIWIRKFGPKSNWYKKHKNKPELIQKSLATLEEEYRFFILENHKIMQDSKNLKNIHFILSQYKTYLSTFKNSPKKDEMHFFYAELLFEAKKYKQAANQYQWIITNDKKSEYYKKSYFNLILSLERLLPSIQKISQSTKNKKSSLAFKQEVKIFQEYTKKFLKAFPQNKNRLQLEYKLALFSYHQNDLLSAEQQSKNIIKKHPKSQQARLVTQLMLDFYQTKGNAKKFSEMSQFVLKNMPNVPLNIKNQIRETEITQLFKNTEELEKKGEDSLSIAQSYKALIKKKLKPKLLAIALFNTAIHLEKAKKHLESLKYYNLFIQNLKKEKNPSQEISNLFKPATHSRALLYEKLGFYQKAADQWVALSKKYKKDRKSLELLLKAALIYDGLNLYQKALKNYNLYSKNSAPKNQAKVFYLIGKMSEKKSKYQTALTYFNRFIQNKFADQAEKVKVAFFLSEINEKLGRKKQSSFWTQKTLSIYKTLNSKNQLKVARFAAQSSFKSTHSIYLKFKQIRPTGNEKQQSLALQKKINLLEDLKNSVQKTISYKDSYQIVAALAIQGHAFRDISETILSSPIPKGLSQKDITIYKQEIKKAASPFEKFSQESYELARKKVKDFKVFGKWRKEVQKIQRRPSSKIRNLENFIKNPLGHIHYLKKYKSKQSINKKSLIALIRKGSPNSIVLDSLSKILDQNPNHIFALNLLGIHHTLRNEDGLAKIIFERALNIAKKRSYKSALYNNLSILYVKEKDFQTAITIKEL